MATGTQMTPEDREPGQPPTQTERLIRLDEAATAGSKRPGIAQLLSSTDAEERRRALRDLVDWGLTAREVPALVELMSDPDVSVRTLAIEGLSERADEVDPARLREALEDPADPVRAAAIALAANRSAPDLSELIPFVAERRWPLAQRLALEVLPRLVHHVGVSDIELSSILQNVARLASPPTPPEGERLAELARALGRDRIAEALSYADGRRLGAVCLLLADGSGPSLRLLAGLGPDPLEEVQLAVATARERLIQQGLGIAERAVTVDLAAVERSTEAEVVGLLVGALSDPDREVRDRAWAALTHVDWEVMLGWVRTRLRDGSDEEASLAAYVAERLMLSQVAAAILDRAARMPPEYRGPLESALSSFGLEGRDLAGTIAEIDVSCRDAAVTIIWRAGGRSVMPHLRPLLEDSSGAVRCAVLEVMDEAGEPETREVALAALEGDPSVTVRKAAVRALAGARGEVRTAALERSLADPDSGVRATALELLAPEPGERSVPLLLGAIEDGDDCVRNEALRQLAAPERAPEDVWQALLRCPKDRREGFLDSLEQSGPERLERLALAHLRSQSEEERSLGLECARRAGTLACLAGVIEVLHHPSAATRTSAARSLASLRRAISVPALRDALSDPDPEVRLEVVRALEAIDDRTVLRHLVDAFGDPDARVRDAAASALSSVRFGDSTVDLIIDRLAEQSGALTPEMRSRLERIVDLDGFVVRLGSLDRNERLRALDVVVAIGGPRATDALIGALSDPDIGVRLRALRWLGRVGDPRAILAVRRTISGDPVREVVSVAEETLGGLAEEGDPRP